MVASIGKTGEGIIGFEALKGVDMGITNGWIKKYDTVLAPFLMFIVYTCLLPSLLHVFSGFTVYSLTVDLRFVYTLNIIFPAH